MELKTSATQQKNVLRLGDAIREYRKRAGVTLEELANDIGCPVSTLQGYESGARKYPLNCIANIGKRLQIPLKSFLEVSVNRILRENGIKYIATLHEPKKIPLQEGNTEII